ncbi:MAG: nitroreductase family protein [Desulfatirhabdiaceae bacterium]|nr:nitroreductase family protein [Desulfatirhabdiaceae bacterium]
MSLVTIDAEKCQRDGICVAECPARLLELKPGGAVPETIPEADELCIGCGHCVAVCPFGALSHKNLSPQECAPVRKELVVGAEQAEQFLRSRRSIRVYKKTPVEKNTLLKLIDVARFAPSGHNSQPVRWLVIQESKEVLRLAGMVIDWMRYVQKEHPAMAQTLHMERAISAWEAGKDPICRNAPHLVVAYGDKSNMTAQSACVIALTYLELAASAFGLGACWAGYFNAAATFWPPLQGALALPENHASYGAMMIGYPKFAYHRLPERNEANITWR